MSVEVIFVSNCGRKKGGGLAEKKGSKSDRVGQDLTVQLDKRVGKGEGPSAGERGQIRTGASDTKGGVKISRNWQCWGASDRKGWYSKKKAREGGRGLASEMTDLLQTGIDELGLKCEPDRREVQRGGDPAKVETHRAGRRKLFAPTTTRHRDNTEKEDDELGGGGVSSGEDELKERQPEEGAQLGLTAMRLRKRKKQRKGPSKWN